MDCNKNKIGIVYFSDTGNTEQLANAISKGINSVSNSEIIQYKIDNSDIVNGVFHNEALFEQLADCTAIAFGSPTYMGSVSAQMKAFMDSSAFLWEQQEWADKLAIGFTSGTGINGEQSCTLQTLFTFACQHGMLWLGVDKHNFSKENLNRMGSQIGIVAHTLDANINGLHPVDVATAEYMGQRLAKFVQKIS